MGSHELKVTVNDAILHRHTLPVEYRYSTGYESQ